ncbi:MAG: hypothetical protein JWO37_2632 [Acidimicrobiales bacterium]|nr:hypothetical protein [Acidimicrobiales bacterium]
MPAGKTSPPRTRPDERLDIGPPYASTMLSPADDYPIHQVAEVIRHPGTSDRNFYDRYYFNLYTTAGDTFAVFGLGQYPNLGTTDAFLAVSHGGTHRVVRASRELGANRMDIGVGPLRVEVLEGLQKLRVVLEPNEWGLEIDAVFDGTHPATLEPRQYIRDFERVTFDTQRLAQTGRWTGTLTAGGTTFDVDPKDWWGYRDRSWGVRPVGDPEPPGIRASNQSHSFFWCYTPLQFEDHSVLVIMQERADGERLLEEAIRIWNDPARGVDHLGRPDHEVEFVPGTRAPRRTTLHLQEPDGSKLDIELEVLMPFYITQGTGYSPAEDWAHGKWQGPLEVQGREYDLADPAVQGQIFGFLENTARATQSNGATGFGMLEFACIGPHHKYFDGFEDFTLFPPAG